MHEETQGLLEVAQESMRVDETRADEKANRSTGPDTQITGTTASPLSALMRFASTAKISPQDSARRSSGGRETVSNSAPAVKERWSDFESYWQDVGRERLRLMKKDFARAPPPFRMPRLRYFRRPWDVGRWERAWNGPMPEDMWTTEKKQAMETAVEKEQRERQHQLEQRALQESNFCRLYGFQLVFFFLWAFGAVYIYAHFRMQFWRFLCWFTLLFFQLIFANFWIKAVIQLRNIIFMWLRETMEHVEECGEVVVINIRRQLFSRVFGMYLCGEARQSRILKDKSAMTSYSPAVFADVEFLDDFGYSYRFVRDEKGGRACSVDSGKTFQVPLNRQLGLEMCIDVNGKAANQLMSEDAWFAKLEFRLKREGPLVPDYPVYLGSFVFGDKIRFAVSMALFPVVSYIGCFFLYTRVHELHRPRVYLDSILMQKHFAVVLGMSLCAIGASILCRQFSFIYASVNLCMKVVEWGVRGELLRHHPTVGDDDNPHDVQDICLLWQKATTEENVKAIGEKMWERIHNFGHRATKQFNSLL